MTFSLRETSFTNASNPVENNSLPPKKREEGEKKTRRVRFQASPIDGVSAQFHPEVALNKSFRGNEDANELGVLIKEPRDSFLDRFLPLVINNTRGSEADPGRRSPRVKVRLLFLPRTRPLSPLKSVTRDEITQRRDALSFETPKRNRVFSSSKEAEKEIRKAGEKEGEEEEEDEARVVATRRSFNCFGGVASFISI